MTSEATAGLEKAYNFLVKEYSTLHTGRADARLVEDVEIELYGMKQPLKHLANISVPDAQSILIDPWDKSALGAIDKTIENNSNLSFSVKNDGVVIRLTVPVLTEERRKEVVKLAHSLAEKARISVRNARQELHSELKKQKEDKEISEDEFFRTDKELQEEVDAMNKKIDDLAKKKEAEILTI